MYTIANNTVALHWKPNEQTKKEKKTDAKRMWVVFKQFCKLETVNKRNTRKKFSLTKSNYSLFGGYEKNLDFSDSEPQ